MFAFSPVILGLHVSVTVPLFDLLIVSADNVTVGFGWLAFSIVNLPNLNCFTASLLSFAAKSTFTTYTPGFDGFSDVVDATFLPSTVVS